MIYVTEPNAIRKIAPDGTVTTFAGNKGNSIKDVIFFSMGALFIRSPEYITIDKKKNIYVTDKGIDDKKNAYFVIRKISPQGEVTTLKDHDGRELHFDACGLVCDDDGNIIACDMGSRCIKKISPDGTVSVIAGQCGKRFSNPIYKEGDIKTAELMTPLDIYLAKPASCIFQICDYTGS